MLTGPEILRLYSCFLCMIKNRGCVNKVMNMAVHRDVVWIKVFKQDCKEDVDNVIQNEWLKKKWDLFNPAILPSEQPNEAM